MKRFLSLCVVMRLSTQSFLKRDRILPITRYILIYIYIYDVFLGRRYSTSGRFRRFVAWQLSSIVRNKVFFAMSTRDLSVLFANYYYYRYREISVEHNGVDCVGAMTNHNLLIVLQICILSCFRTIASQSFENLSFVVVHLRT